MNVKESCDSEIITEEEVDGRNIPIGMDDVQSIKFRVLILNPILL
jgi:hypothetical protein